MQINSIEDLINHNLPVVVLQDIDKRITDWLAGGGSIEDGYIKQQFRFAENFINWRDGNCKRI